MPAQDYLDPSIAMLHLLPLLAFVRERMCDSVRMKLTMQTWYYGRKPAAVQARI